VQCIWSFLHRPYDHQQVKSSSTYKQNDQHVSIKIYLEIHEVVVIKLTMSKTKAFENFVNFVSVPGSWCLFQPVYWLPSWAYRIDAPFWPPTNAPWKMNGKWLKNNFYWVLIPLLTMVIASIPFLFFY
jgi:hypothetical protein